MTAITSEAYRAMSLAQPMANATTSSPVFLTTSLQLWQLRAVELLARLRHLPKNWDSYNALPPAEDVLDIAMETLGAPGLPDAVVPRVLPLASGGVQISWSSGGREADIEIGNDLETNVLLSENDELVLELPSVALQPLSISTVVGWVNGSK